MNSTHSVAGALTPYNHEKIDVSTAAIGFTASIIDSSGSVAERDKGPVRLVLVTVETQNIRYTFDGTTPVGNTTGHFAAVGDKLLFAGLQTARLFRAIRDINDNADLMVTYLR